MWSLVIIIIACIVSISASWVYLVENYKGREVVWQIITVGIFILSFIAINNIENDKEEQLQEIDRLKEQIVLLDTTLVQVDSVVLNGVTYYTNGN